MLYVLLQTYSNHTKDPWLCDVSATQKYLNSFVCPVTDVNEIILSLYPSTHQKLRNTISAFFNLIPYTFVVVSSLVALLIVANFYFQCNDWSEASGKNRSLISKRYFLESGAGHRSTWRKPNTHCNWTDNFLILKYISNGIRTKVTRTALYKRFRSNDP